MKILNNFDTDLEKETVSKYIEMYGEENILVIHRAKIFWVIRCLLPFLLWISLLVGIIIFWLRETNDDIWQNIKGILAIIIFFAIFVMGWGILKKYLDYKMDFCIVTPNEVAMYNQSWLFRRNTRIIDADKIKTVSTDTAGFFKSVFNFWNLIFLSEWDPSTDSWDISLNFVHAVNDTKNKVRDLIEPHLQKNSTDINPTVGVE